MNASQIVKQLEKQGGAANKQILVNHGAREPVLGVKIGDLKAIQKQIKRDHELALELYDTGIYDAQYLAGLIADQQRMTKRDLKRWLSQGNCPAICASVVAWVTAESRYGWELASAWVESQRENTAQTGWMTMGSLVSIKDDSDLDLAQLKRLLGHVEKTIHDQPNLVRYAMNHFVIAVGCYVDQLTERAIRAADEIGPVSVDVGDTACEVPSAAEYIHKVQRRGAIGKKRKTARC